MDPPAPKTKKTTTRTAVHDSRAPKNNHHNNNAGDSDPSPPRFPVEEGAELFSWNVFKKTFPKNPGLFSFRKGLINTPEILYRMGREFGNLQNPIPPEGPGTGFLGGYQPTKKFFTKDFHPISTTKITRVQKFRKNPPEQRDDSKLEYIPASSEIVCK